MSTTDRPIVIPIWQDAVPGLEAWPAEEEQETFLPLPPVIPQTFLPLPFGIPIRRNITQPTLTVFRPDPALANGTAVIIAPGGVFHFLAVEREGTEIARQLVARGITAMVLKYRV